MQLRGGFEAPSFSYIQMQVDVCVCDSDTNQKEQAHQTKEWPYKS